jgi:hypothetical protein
MAGLLPQNLILNPPRRILYHKITFGTRNPAFWVGAVIGHYFLVVFLCPQWSFVVHWLGCPFAFFALELCSGKNANVQPKALAICQTY